MTTNIIFIRKLCEDQTSYISSALSNYWNSWTYLQSCYNSFHNNTFSVWGHPLRNSICKIKISGFLKVNLFTYILYVHHRELHYTTDLLLPCFATTNTIRRRILQLSLECYIDQLSEEMHYRVVTITILRIAHGCATL